MFLCKFSSLKHLSIQSKCIKLQFENGQESWFHKVWLRDHCRCSDCYHTVTRQRLLPTRNIINATLKKAEITNDNQLAIEWTDKHSSFFSADWLSKHSYHPRIPRKSNSLLSTAKVLWDESNAFPKAHDFAAIMSSNQALLAWIKDIIVYGMGLVANVPISTEVCFHPTKRRQNLSRSGSVLFEKHITEAFGISHPTCPRKIPRIPTYLSTPIQIQLTLQIRAVFKSFTCCTTMDPEVNRFTLMDSNALLFSVNSI